MTTSLKQCAVLLINPCLAGSAHRLVLEATGFHVRELREWPDDDRVVVDFEVVMLRMVTMSNAPMLAARLRAKPRFGRRVLIALVPASASAEERHSARASGFDEVLSDDCDSRQLIARILRRLRSRPEYRCLVPAGDRRRQVA